MPAHASLLRNLGRAHDFEALEVEGVIPPDLAGTLYRAGPGVFERFGVAVGHPFDADGIITAVRVDSTGARAAVQIIETAGYRNEQRAGRRLYGSGAARHRQLLNTLRGRGKNTANTTAWAWNGGLYALMEGGRPTELDPDTLAYLGERDFDEVIVRNFSAHPRRVAELETTFNFGVRYERRCTLDLFALPDGGPARRLGAVELPHHTLIHDFIATPTHLVFIVEPVEVVTWRALLGIGGLGKMLRWNPGRGAELIAVPLDAVERPQRFECEVFWAWHYANGFNRGSELVVDVCRYPEFDSFGAIAEGGGVAQPPRYQRMIVDLAGERIEYRDPLRDHVEFPRVHPAVGGREHRFAWVVHERDEPGTGEGVARVEAETGQVRPWLPPATVAAGEPIVVARGPGHAEADEADVWVLSLCHDDERDRSFVAILDGHEPERGPVAKLWFDQTIPLSFHGVWLAGSARAPV